jgi:DNA mismatch endonuclease (patch repair protein)
MARIHNKDSKAEMAVRSAAHRLGFRFRLHSKGLPGHPDLVFPVRRKIVFVHGCFWHRHPGCKRATSPKTREKQWQEKFRRNVERDRETESALESLGWKVLTVWECETFDREKLTSILAAFLE